MKLSTKVVAAFYFFVGSVASVAVATKEDGHCEAHETHIRLELKTHKRPQNIRWKLVDTCKNVQIYEKGYHWKTKYLSRNSEEAEDYCLPRTKYRFTLNEKWRNPRYKKYEINIWGKGDYKLMQDGEVVGKGDSMGSVWESGVSNDFGEQCAPTPGPTEFPTQAPFAHQTFCPGSDQSHFHVDLKTHTSPMAVRWKLHDECTGEVVAKKGFGLFGMYYNRHTLYEDDYCLPPSKYRKYRMEVWTENGGSLCCSYDNHGYYEVEEDGQTVAEGAEMPETTDPDTYIRTAKESKVFGECDDSWEPPETIDRGPGDISDGQCAPCQIHALVAGCIPCKMFRENENGVPEKCKVPFCEDLSSEVF
jgi:hypothetical protein